MCTSARERVPSVAPLTVEAAPETGDTVAVAFLVRCRMRPRAVVGSAHKPQATTTQQRYKAPNPASGMATFRAHEPPDTAGSFSFCPQRGSPPAHTYSHRAVEMAHVPLALPAAPAEAPGAVPLLGVPPSPNTRLYVSAATRRACAIWALTILCTPHTRRDEITIGYDTIKKTQAIHPTQQHAPRPIPPAAQSASTRR
jgi:hypothetical protein